jgi:L-ascorbate metabolism protein UlaG (beta-lactamase superfamily)
MNNADATTVPPLAVTWFGHATALIEIDGVRLLTDPVLRGRVSGLTRIAPAVPSQAIGSVDAVLLSHLHADHADPRSLRMLGPETLVIAPAGAAEWLAAQGVANVRELAPGELAELAGITVTATPAVHDGRRWRYGARADSVGFIVAGSQALYFAGDTDLFDEMSEMAGRIDVALLPVTGWGPTLGTGHLDPERASIAAQRIAPRLAIPIHWGTLAVPALRRTADPGEPAREFAQLTSSRLAGVDVRVLQPGERTEIAAAARVP